MDGSKEFYYSIGGGTQFMSSNSTRMNSKEMYAFAKNRKVRRSPVQTSTELRRKQSLLKGLSAEATDENFLCSQYQKNHQTES